MKYKKTRGISVFISLEQYVKIVSENLGSISECGS